MPLTVSALARTPRLGLRVLTAAERTEEPVAWVHVSELADPAPYLQGGELLLTTGLALAGDDAGAAEEYVRRLTRAGVVALGFGTGLSHAQVPPALLEAARACGLPVLEVPEGTPFIAISRAVSRALAAEEYATLTRTHAAQQALARAALSADAPAALVRSLAGLVDGWVLVADAHGAPLHAWPSSAAGRADRLRADLDRLRAHRPPASAVLAEASETVLLQSLGSGPRVRALLVVGRAAPFTGTDRHIVNAAALLLALGQERSSGLEQAEAALRSAVLRLALRGEVAAAADVVRGRWGAVPDAPVHVLSAVGPAPLRSAAADLAAEAAARTRAALFTAELDGALVLLAAAGSREAQGPQEPLLEALLDLPRRLPGLALGVSEPLPHARLDDAHRQSRQAADAGVRAGRPVTRFADLAGAGLLHLLDPDRARAFADAALAPLVEHDRAARGDLVRSLRAWLEHHGQWDPPAAQLGVHRHTLRKRINRVEELLGRDLGSPGARAELWLALQLAERATG